MGKYLKYYKIPKFVKHILFFLNLILFIFKLDKTHPLIVIVTLRIYENTIELQNYEFVDICRSEYNMRFTYMPMHILYMYEKKLKKVPISYMYILSIYIVLA